MPPTAKNLLKIGKTREEKGKIGEKRENIGKRGTIGKKRLKSGRIFTLPLLTERAGYDTGSYKFKIL